MLVVKGGGKEMTSKMFGSVLKTQARQMGTLLDPGSSVWYCWCGYREKALA